ncbi:unnamed protein product [Candidula unifasciata]|uniref:Sulfhydryl oxidase n=1 Tax=Candidula unifasciata TaxID=100452 RepID=A0A8S3YRV0_9EUPU|nr:unnamed protein product [Candidula unifasciata]
MSAFIYGFLLLIVNGYLVFGIKDGLYDTEVDDVLPLNNESFQAMVVKGKPDIVWVVEFYNSWCGHCIHFAPTWKEVATYFKDWQDLVVIAAIDCTQPANLETCRQHDVSSYPTLKIFPPASVQGGKIQTLHSNDKESIKKWILDFMVKNAPISWPHLQPLEKIEDIWLDKKETHQHVLLIFEEEDSPVGTEVIIDVRKIRSVLVRRMPKRSVVKYGISKFPSLYTVRPDSTYNMLSVGTKMFADDRVAFVQTIKALANSHPGDSKNIISSNKSREQNLGKEPHDEMLPAARRYNSSVVSMQDLESALHYSLRQEVALKKHIDGDTFLALQTFLDTLVKYFPGRKPILGFLVKTRDMLRSLGKNNITGEEWMNKIDSLQDRDNYLPAVIKWEFCHGSSPLYRGYPCSMWVLFHTLTVSAYNQNTGTRHGNPQEVLLAIRSYMKHFFGCQECSKNFVSMAQSVEGEVHNYKDSVIWLWSAHNKANKRLHGDLSEDPEHPKIEFPSEKMCLQCRIKTSTDAETQVSWHMEKVLEFLVSFYSEKNIVPSQNLVSDEVSANSLEKREVDWWESKLQEQDLKQIRWLREKKQKQIQEMNQRIYNKKDSNYSARLEENHVFSLWGLTHLDFSLCLIFYLLSTVIILSMYHHFIVRRRMVTCRNIMS